MRELRMTMTEPQARFFQLTDKYPLFCGGFGVGKTETLLNCALRDGLESPNALIALYEPTYDLVRMILAPRLEQKLTDLGIKFKYNKMENIIRPIGGFCGSFVLRTLDNPARIVGYESYRAHVDEIDTLKPIHALEAWRKIIARNRQKPRGIGTPFNRVSAYSTPEGFRFAYDTWVKDVKPGYVVVQAPTSSNPFLPDDYIQGLRDSYPPQLIEAYLEGKFVNLTSGSIYPEFSRVLNNTDAELQPAKDGLPGEAIHVGMDFNVNKMAAAIFVIRAGLPYGVAELTKVRDTPEMARLLKERYKDTGHAVTIYPDASGANTSSKGASVSDLSILKSAGFTLRAPLANPRVKDRINAVNAMILNASGTRRLKINAKQCPTLVEGLEQQVYDDKGEPDKDSGHDHGNDAIGYFCNTWWPVAHVQTGYSSIPYMER